MRAAASIERLQDELGRPVVHDDRPRVGALGRRQLGVGVVDVVAGAVGEHRVDEVRLDLGRHRALGARSRGRRCPGDSSSKSQPTFGRGRRRRGLPGQLLHVGVDQHRRGGDRVRLAAPRTRIPYSVSIPQTLRIATRRRYPPEPRRDQRRRARRSAIGRWQPRARRTTSAAEPARPVRRPRRAASATPASRSTRTGHAIAPRPREQFGRHATRSRARPGVEPGAAPPVVVGDRRRRPSRVHRRRSPRRARRARDRRARRRSRPAAAAAGRRGSARRRRLADADHEPAPAPASVDSAPAPRRRPGRRRRRGARCAAVAGQVVRPRPGGTVRRAPRHGCAAARGRPGVEDDERRHGPTSATNASMCSITTSGCSRCT